jgi:hypothetical protein
MAENAYATTLVVRPSDEDGQILMREPITIRTDDDAEDLIAACDNAETAARLALCWNSHDRLAKLERAIVAMARHDLWLEQGLDGLWSWRVGTKWQRGSLDVALDAARTALAGLAELEKEAGK